MSADIVHKHYITISTGQVHLRSLGPMAGPPLVLLHWTPSSGVMFRHAMPLLAEAGLRVHAVDLPGYGRSDPRPPGPQGDWRIADYGRALVEVLRQLGGDAPVLYGGHMGAAAAMEVALQAPERLRGLILDGCPAWDAATRAKIAQHMSGGTPPPIEPEGGHLVKLWAGIGFFRKEWDAERPLEKIAPEDAWGHVVDMIATGFASSAAALVENDMAERARDVRVPTLLLTADGDPLHDQHAKMVEAIPEARDHRFTGPHPLHRPELQAQWVAPILDFVKVLAPAPVR